LSGIDEQKPVCSECGNYGFEKTYYGYRKDRATIDEDTNEIRIYEDDWRSNDCEEWCCTNCHHMAPEQIREILDEKMMEMW
jgi:ribonucleotide reductase alpha subunit